VRPRNTWKIEAFPWVRFVDETDSVLKAIDPNRLAILVGAGVSVSPPSRMPTAFQFLRNFYEICLPASCDKQLFLPWVDPNAIVFSDLTDLRFETVLGIVQHSFDKKLNILKLFCSGQPNLNHRCLNLLAQSGAIIITTNFDSLIEDAYPELYEYRLRVREEDFEDLLEKGVTSVPEFWHIHGMIRDPISKEDITDSIVASIRDCWNSKDLFRLDRAKGQALEKALSERDLLIVGYSGSDDYDIAPALEQIHSNRRLVWIQHTPDHRRSQAKWIIDRLPDGTSWYRAPSANSLATMIGAGVRQRDDIYLVQSDTGLLLQRLAGLTGDVPSDTISSRALGSFIKRFYSSTADFVHKTKTPAKSQSLSDSSLTNYFSSWRDAHIADESSRYLLAIRLCEAGGLFREEQRLLIEYNKICSQFLTLTPATNSSLCSHFNLLLKVAEHFKGDLHFLFESQEFTEFIERQPYLKANLELTMGRIQSDAGQIEEAISHFEESLRIRHAIDFIRDIEVAEYELAHVLLIQGYESKNLDKAEQEAHRSLHSAISASHPEGIAHANVLLARICERLERNEEAKAYYRQACDGAYRSGQEKLIAQSYGEFGLFLMNVATTPLIAERVERTQQVLGPLIDAVSEYPITNDERLMQSMIAGIAHSTANFFAELPLRAGGASREDCEQAVSFLSEAFRIHSRQKDWYALQIIASNLAECLEILGDGKRSLLSHCTAFRCASYFNDEETIELSLTRIRSGALRELKTIDFTMLDSEALVSLVQKELIKMEILI